MNKKTKIKLVSGWMLLSIILAISLGCGNSRTGRGTQEAASGISSNKTDIKVTFIELGSVKCIPCRMMQPVMKQIEEQYGDQVKVVFHDVWTDAGKPYAVQYNIQAIPTQVFLDAEGKEYFRHTGFFPLNDLVKVLKQKGVK